MPAATGSPTACTHPSRPAECELAKLTNKMTLIQEARQELDAAHLLVKALPQILGEVSRSEQEQLIMALIDRIEVTAANEVSINLRLDAAVIHALPSLQSAASLQPESQPSADSPAALSDSSTELDHAPQPQQAKAVRQMHSMGYMRG